MILRILAGFFRSQFCSKPQCTKVKLTSRFYWIFYYLYYYIIYWKLLLHYLHYCIIYWKIYWIFYYLYYLYYLLKLVIALFALLYYLLKIYGCYFIICIIVLFIENCCEIGYQVSFSAHLFYTLQVRLEVRDDSFDDGVHHRARQGQLPLLQSFQGPMSHWQAGQAHFQSRY